MQDTSAEFEVNDTGHLGLSHTWVPPQADDMQMHMLKVQPMVVPPLPWRSLESGGLLFTRFPVMRTRTAAQVQALQEAEAAAPDGLRRVSCSSSQKCWLRACPCEGALDRGCQELTPACYDCP